MNNSIQGNRIRKAFDKPTPPEQPIRRKLTKEEHLLMFNHFRDHSWSGIDANGRIILGGGESNYGKFYITEDDLLTLKK